MCRLLGYLGSPIQLDQLLYKPEHSLIVQSYQPKEMTSGVVNADGLGIGWYDSTPDIKPFTYKNTLPIWNDINLPELSRYVQSGCMLAYVRSATAGQALDLSNCQPFRRDRLLLIHNGFIKNFRKTLYRPIRDRLSDEIYQSIHGTTDSEHIFALFVNQLCRFPDSTIEQALYATLTTLTEITQAYETSISANLIITDGSHLVASRYGCNTTAPTLYWLRDDPSYPNAVIIASEPLFTGHWHTFPENSLISVSKSLDVQMNQLVYSISS
ncbi:MAG TPA: ergothioneine biosynthesis protein EgtC [Cyanobacteria bacterium UBA12227]|nr:ergothioneine biosynthesis protein EgtC [Cyanobacteria bacterium UBA12227]HAX90110.1 ergothioneine biosynthesis protein EgtC [Cyanobacteria bacterium UBA11370]HBY77428.1 ergothioneine biosynthesis protein EgtC [Cyanobacteria bacterium UBA11148]